jgi:hypothetical protein
MIGLNFEEQIENKLEVNLNQINVTRNVTPTSTNPKAYCFSESAKEDPCTTFIRTDGVLLKVCNQKEECRTWCLIATISHILALKLTASLRLMIRSHFSLFESLLEFPK